MLISMAVFDSPENGRTQMTEETLKSLVRTVDLGDKSPPYDVPRHRLVISDNGSCEATHRLYRKYAKHIEHVIYNGENLGTARAINKAWTHRAPGEHAAKIDNDVRIHQCNWADWIEDAFERDPQLGILALKRSDLAEDPWRTDAFKSSLRMLPHTRGQRWIVIEDVNGVMGTCQAFSSTLLDRIGYLSQPGVYGYDDALASVRAKVSGFGRAFLCGFEIDHIDPGGTSFSQWKIKQANMGWGLFQQLCRQYESGSRDVYVGPEG